MVAGLSANRGKDSSISTSIFYTRWFKDAEAGVRDEGTYKADALDEGARGTLLFDLAVPEGTDMKGWLGSLDVFISFESPLLAIFQLAERLRVRRSILVLNIDWSCAKEIRRISEVPNLQFWVKGPGGGAATGTYQRVCRVPGVPVLATDGWPMNEVVTDNVNGLLLKAAYMGNFFADDHKCTIQEFAEDSCKEMMGPHWEVDVEDMARAIVRFSTDEELRRRLSAPHPHVLLSRQFAFMNTM
ncbi:hypothetical protein GUITHDRAFT_109376 [Guillardia theta CCMP2712]|uniref:Uncharacterized protein n=1 Tax=Guillardia theta (strain CCMP2712) TaxID=905079 RepID=L1J950_GUITC|nr:hypothetical protein GUITHDRAFT_109376 [Guillardia theta CCMP2712]EKX44600.1 hypothetical protein GUITHDRAFT_109376 [Guillardia theta CCMP2712]|eukprot:XP_005831580.1 hypothetical protein GUITHDRAFT_109376 [Guillardia theta CCMP2712]